MYLSDKFYSATKEFNTFDSHVAAPYFRKNFFLEKVPEKITATVSGQGFYDIYVNGKKITKGILAPYISNLDDICYYDSYDITDYVKNGKNTLAFLLGNGTKDCIGGTVWNLTECGYTGAPQLAFAIEYGDTLIEADETVKTAPSPIIFDDLRLGCHYDAGKEIENWNLPDFDDSTWANAFPSESPKGEKRICEADPIVLREELKPVSVRKATLDKTYDTDKNYYPNRVFSDAEYEGYLFDFGVNCAGRQLLKINAKAGQKLEFQPCEYINENGDPSYNNLLFYPDGYTQRDIYICKDGYQEFEPEFTYHGCRYIFINGLTEEQATADALTFKVYSSDIKKRAGFNCSDLTACRLMEISERSDISNYYYFPTDCPQREKNGWTGDIFCSTEHMLLRYTCEKSVKEWMRNVVKAQNDAGTIPGIVPTTGWGFAWGNGPVFDNCISHLPYSVARFTDDGKIIEESADAILKYVKYSMNSRNADGLINYGLGDWVKPKSDLPTATVECISSIVIMALAYESEKIFLKAGMTDRAEISRKYGDELKTAIRNKYLDKENCTVDGGIMSSQSLAVFYKVFTEDEMPKASKYLADSIVNNGYRHDCGFPGVRGLFHALSDNGYADIAFKLLVGKNYTNYGLFLDQGLTTLPEGFDCIEDNGIPKAWRSLNHHFIGDYTNWLISKIAGIRVNEDFTTARHIDVKPTFVTALSFAEAYYNSDFGNIEVRWEKEDGSIVLNIKTDGELFGNTVAPCGYVFSDGKTEIPLASGKYVLKKA